MQITYFERVEGRGNGEARLEPMLFVRSSYAKRDELALIASSKRKGMEIGPSCLQSLYGLSVIVRIECP